MTRLRLERRVLPGRGRHAGRFWRSPISRSPARTSGSWRKSKPQTPSKLRPSRNPSQIQGTAERQSRAPGAIQPAFTWAGRLPTSCRGKGLTGCSARHASRKSSPRPCSTPSRFPAARPSPTSGPAPATTASAWPSGSGPRGRFWPPTSSPRCCEMLRNNAREAGVTNIKPIRATQTDTKLPDAKVDLILMVDVYHECSDPETTLKGLFKALKPLGRLVLVEFRGEDPEVPIKPEHKMTLKQVRREVEPQGFVFKDSLEFLPWQHVIIFEKPAEAKKPDAKTRHARQWTDRRPTAQSRSRHARRFSDA